MLMMPGPPASIIRMIETPFYAKQEVCCAKSPSPPPRLKSDAPAILKRTCGRFPSSPYAPPEVYHRLQLGQRVKKLASISDSPLKS